MTTAPDPAPRQHPASHYVDALGTIACVYLGLITLGFAAFRFLDTLPTGATHNQDRTFFTSVNAVTLTGFAQSFAGVPGFPLLGKAVLAALALGGALTAMIGAGYFGARALRLDLSLRRLVIWSALMLLVPMVGMLAVGWFDAVSASTGLGLSSARSLTEARRVLLVAMAVPASVGPLLLFALLTRQTSRYIAAMLVALVTLYVVGLLAWSGDSILHASLQSLNLRSAGLPVARIDPAPASGWIAITLMMLGAGPGGTGGGLGVLPLVILVLGARDVLARRPRIDPLLGVALAWAAALAALLVVTLVLLSSVQNALPGDRLLFIVVSAICNVGVSHDPIGLTGPALFVLSGATIAGRLLPIAMLCWMACVAEAEDAGATAASPHRQPPLPPRSP